MIVEDQSRKPSASLRATAAAPPAAPSASRAASFSTTRHVAAEPRGAAAHKSVPTPGFANSTSGDGKRGLHARILVDVWSVPLLRFFWGMMMQVYCWVFFVSDDGTSKKYRPERGFTIPVVTTYACALSFTHTYANIEERKGCGLGVASALCACTHTKHNIACSFVCKRVQCPPSLCLQTSGGGSKVIGGVL